MTDISTLVILASQIDSSQEILLQESVGGDEECYPIGLSLDSQLLHYRSRCVTLVCPGRFLLSNAPDATNALLFLSEAGAKLPKEDVRRHSKRVPSSQNTGGAY